jgi:metacaspase-1
MKVLLVHGVGYQEDEQFETKWQPVIARHLGVADIAFSQLNYDALFKSRYINWLTALGTIKDLAASWIEHATDDRPMAERALGIPDSTAGMVLKWAAFDDLRETLRERLAAEIAEVQPDVIVAHSLGTLICYDYFSRVANAGARSNITLLTCGCQIAHPTLREVFDGYLPFPKSLKRWYAFYNPYDRVFAWDRLPFSDSRFVQVETPFHAAFINHDATEYFKHAAAQNVWRVIGGGTGTRNISFTSGQMLAGSIQVHAAGASTSAKFADKLRKPNRRALLVGINQYAAPGMELAGCVNDAYLMSALLQEQGFDADDIRMVVDDRATTAAIQQRIQWLLSDTQAGDVRILYFSGHGVQMPVYGPSGKPEQIVEALVPHDFDWSPAKSINDKWLATQYGNLPYASHMVAIFDCCHAGGLSRGAALKVRSISPPDDIAHRQLKWDTEWQMWVPRDFMKPKAGAPKGPSSLDPAMPMRQLGRAVSLRPSHMKNVGKAFGHKGPYMPTILMACKATELAHEYRHGGGHSYGAFTYALSQVLRDAKRAKIKTAKDLCNQINARLPALGYQQHCVPDGPSKQLVEVGKWITNGVGK